MLSRKQFIAALSGLPFLKWFNKSPPLISSGLSIVITQDRPPEAILYRNDPELEPNPDWVCAPSDVRIWYFADGQWKQQPDVKVS